VSEKEKRTRRENDAEEKLPPRIRRGGRTDDAEEKLPPRILGSLARVPGRSSAGNNDDARGRGVVVPLAHQLAV
jgi:hypothetical protein